MRHDVLENIVSTMSINLSRFWLQLVQHKFISSDTAADTMSRMGSSNREKAMEFFRSVETKLQNSEHPQELFEQFVEILEEDARDLAVKITKNYGEGKLSLFILAT